MNFLFLFYLFLFPVKGPQQDQYKRKWPSLPCPIYCFWQLFQTVNSVMRLLGLTALLLTMVYVLTDGKGIEWAMHYTPKFWSVFAWLWNHWPLISKPQHLRPRGWASTPLKQGQQMWSEIDMFLISWLPCYINYAWGIVHNSWYYQSLLQEQIKFKTQWGHSWSYVGSVMKVNVQIYNKYHYLRFWNWCWRSSVWLRKRWGTRGCSLNWKTTKEKEA